MKERESTLEISMECWMIKKTVENITKLRTQSKGKGFKNLLPQDEYKLKWVIVRQWNFDQCSDQWKGWNWLSQERQKV